ncbi:midkine isoform X5 [Canis lupus familiaris]|nr:midkine isoform X5 [Canis lupus familiaris]XP_038419380.1 midkine isoform X5 [Canis lupus familiaris]
MQLRGFLLLALLTLLALPAAVAKKKDKVKKGGPGSECAEWTWGPCTPSSKDCGVGFREGTCGAQTQRIRCRVPCNWKKEFGADCKYKFENWGACDGGSGTKARQGTLKKARYNAQCQETIRVTKPCTPKTKAKAKEIPYVSPGGVRGAHRRCSGLRRPSGPSGSTDKLCSAGASCLGFGEAVLEGLGFVVCAARGNPGSAWVPFWC